MGFRVRGQVQVGGYMVLVLVGEDKAFNAEFGGGLKVQIQGS